MKQTDDLRIVGTKELLSPAQLLEQFPISDKASETTMYGRQAIIRLLGDTGSSKRTGTGAYWRSG